MGSSTELTAYLGYYVLINGVNTWVQDTNYIVYSSSNSNVASINGHILTARGVGTATITASIAPKAPLIPRPCSNGLPSPVSCAITVIKGNQNINWNQTLSGTLGDPPITLNATASSGLPVT